MKLFDEFSLLYDEPSAIQAILTFSSVDQIAIMCLGVIALSSCCSPGSRGARSAPTRC